MRDIDKKIKKFEPLMFKLLRKFRIPKRDYDDYLQELRIAAWKVIEKYDKKRGLLSTIMQISLENRIKDLLRKSDNETIFLEDLSHHQKTKALKVKTNFMANIDMDFIKNKLTKLEKKIINLRLKGLTQSKIGKLLNISQSAIQQKWQLILKKLKKLIKRR